MNIKEWFSTKSWKTTSMGLLAIGGGLTRLAFAIKAGTLTEEAVMTILSTLVTGAGLLFSRDNDKASEQVGADPLSKAVKEDAKSNSTPATMWLLLGMLAFAVTGCGTVQRPPSALEQKYFDIQTNVVPIVVLVTNAPAAPDAPAVVEAKTNLVEQYDLTPNANAQAVAGTGAAVGSIWGVGAPVGAGLLGLFTTWALWRSRKKSVATSAELAQIIETGRQVLLSMPDGAKYEAAWKDWMVKHQAETAVIGQVSQLVALSVSKPEARDAAQTIVNLIEAQSKL